VINEEVKEELRRFKELIDQIQEEMKEKDRENSRRVDKISEDIKGIENAVKG